MDYDYDHFISYSAIVRNEMTNRGYRTTNAVWNKITNLKPDWNQLLINEIYKDKMNQDYLTICYYNLYENIFVEK